MKYTEEEWSKLNESKGSDDNTFGSKDINGNEIEFIKVVEQRYN